MSRDDEPPPPLSLSYRTAKGAPHPVRPRAELLLLVVAGISLCLPPISVGLSVLAIVRGMQLRGGEQPDTSRILLIGGIVLLLMSTTLTVLLAMEMR
jgi:hypothetical protein